MTSDASIAGRPATLDAAIAEAASMLRRSRQPVITGLRTDHDGAREAVALARRIGGVIDHDESEAALRDIDVMRRNGWIVTTPLQLRARADVVLLVGVAATDAGLRLDRPPTLAPGLARRVITVDPRDLGVLRALAGGRPVRADPKLREQADALLGAHFGVAVWRASTLDDIAVEMLCGLVEDLNRTTRFAGLPLGAGGNATGVMGAAAALCGFPARAGFARGFAEHDPWRFDARRMIADGEADAAIWLSATDPAAPPWGDAIPTIALTAAGAAFTTPSAVAIMVGRPGVDHDAALFDSSLGTLGFAAARAATSVPSAAAILGRIAAALC